MSVYTRRLGNANLTAAGAQLLFKATAGFTWIVRDLAVSNESSATQELQVWISSGGKAYVLFRAPAAPARSSYHLDLRQELLPDEELWGAGSAGGWTAAVTGYRLDP